MKNLIVKTLLILSIVFLCFLAVVYIYEEIYIDKPDYWYFWKSENEILSLTINSNNRVWWIKNRIIFKYMLKGVKPYSSDLNKALSSVVIGGDKNTNIAEQLINYGAEVENEMLSSPVIRNQQNMVKLLIYNGADIDGEIDYRGDTALLAAVDSQSIETVRLLLAEGADTEVRDYWNRTPLMVAARSGTNMDEECKKAAEIIDLLVDYGADIYAEDEKGRTAYDLAVERHGDNILHGEKDIFAAIQRAEEKTDQADQEVYESDNTSSSYSRGDRAYLCFKPGGFNKFLGFLTIRPDLMDNEACKIIIVEVAGNSHRVEYLEYCNGNSKGNREWVSNSQLFSSRSDCED